MTIHVKDASGTIRQITDPQLKDSGGVVRPIKEAWLRDSGGVLRQFFARAETVVVGVGIDGVSFDSYGFNSIGVSYGSVAPGTFFGYTITAIRQSPTGFSLQIDNGGTPVGSGWFTTFTAQHDGGDIALANADATYGTAGSLETWTWDLTTEWTGDWSDEVGLSRNATLEL